MNNLSEKNYNEIVSILNNHYKTNRFYTMGNDLGYKFKNGQHLIIVPEYLTDPEYKKLLDDDVKNDK